MYQTYGQKLLNKPQINQHQLGPDVVLRMNVEKEKIAILKKFTEDNIKHAEELKEKNAANSGKKFKDLSIIEKDIVYKQNLYEHIADPFGAEVEIPLEVQ